MAVIAATSWSPVAEGATPPLPPIPTGEAWIDMVVVDHDAAVQLAR